MLSEQRQPLTPVRQALVFDELPKEDIAPDRAQPEGDRIKNQPENDFVCCYFWPVFFAVVTTSVVLAPAEIKVFYLQKSD